MSKWWHSSSSWYLGREDSDNRAMATIEVYIYEGVVNPSSYPWFRAVVNEKTWANGFLRHITPDKTWLLHCLFTSFKAGERCVVPFLYTSTKRGGASILPLPKFSDEWETMQCFVRIDTLLETIWNAVVDHAAHLIREVRGAKKNRSGLPGVMSS